MAAEKARVRSLQATLKKAKEKAVTYRNELSQAERQNDLLRNRVAQLEAELRVAKADAAEAQRTADMARLREDPIGALGDAISAGETK